jgi:hypothetical protein
MTAVVAVRDPSALLMVKIGNEMMRDLGRWM